MKINLYKIYYNEATQIKIENPFIPLYNDDTSGWYELMPILNYLNQNTLNDDQWYGFFSTKFEMKTGYTANILNELMVKAEKNKSNVILISPAWDQICYFQNPIEQAEYWHEGIKGIFNEFIKYSDLNFEYEKWATTLNNTVFSNFIVAKKSFWHDWKALANSLIIFSKFDKKLDERTSYGSPNYLVKRKAFIQERIANFILSNNFYSITTPEYEFEYSIDTSIFQDTLMNRKLLITCNELKNSYLKTRNSEYLKIFNEIRNEIKLSNK